MATSFLELLLEDIRIAVDDADVTQRFTDTQILRYAGNMMKKVFTDISLISSQPHVAKLDIAITTDKQLYRLPPCIGELIQIGEWDSDLESWKWRLCESSRWSNTRGMHLNAGRIEFEQMPTEAFTLRVEYLPSGDFLAHEAKSTTSTPAETTTLNLVAPADEATKLVTGSIDDRIDSYIGAKIRLWEETPGASAPAIVREALIADHAVQSGSPYRTVTIDLAWSPVLVAATEYRYEIVPTFLEGVRMAVVYAAAHTLCGLTGMRERQGTLQLEYRKAIRTEMLAEAYKSPYNQKWRKDAWR